MLKKAAGLFLVCASMTPWIGCGSTSSNYLYTTLPTVSEFAAFREDPNSGVLTPLAFSPVTAEPGVQAVVISPSQKFLYTANSGEIPLGTVSLYTISSSGVLAEQGKWTAGTTPSLLAMDSAGAFLYVANTGSEDISVFQIDPTGGTLTPITQMGQSATARIGAFPLNMALAPSGNTLYVTTTGSLNVPGYVEVFPINAGVLSLPVSYTTGTNPYGLAVTPNGGSLYTANTSDGTISEFSISATDGTLASIATLAVGYASPLALLIDKTGKFMFVAESGSSKVSGYSVDPTNGGLAVLPKSPFITTKNPNVIGMDPSGHHIFVGTQNPGSQIESFTLGGDGSLIEVGAYGIPNTPTSMVITP